LNELSSQLAALRGTLDVKRLQNRNVTSSTQGEVKRSAREFLGTDGAVKPSDGIEVDENMLSSNSDGLAAYQATAVDGLGLGDSPVSTLASHSSYKKASAIWKVFVERWSVPKAVSTAFTSRRCRIILSLRANSPLN
jgi:hypothetical protein